MKSMISKRFQYLSLGLLLYWLLSVTLFQNNLNLPFRLASDYYDRLFYFERGAWLPEGLVPYRDVLSEYPQIPTYLFGLLRLFTLQDTNEFIAYWKHSSVFSALMILCLLAVIEMLYKMLPEKKYLAYLLLLPAPLYYTFNRFDILPALFSLISFRLIQDKKWNLAAAMLALGAMTKWYPALLLPPLLVYYYRTEKRIHWQMPVVFASVCFILILPTLITGGMDALMVPYTFHGDRGLETVSLPTLVNQIAQWANPGLSIQSNIMTVFFFLQLVTVLFAFFSKIDSLEVLLYWFILIICGFIAFARIFSPQWLLWILPFYILTIQNKREVGIAIFYGITNYIAFPIVWDYFGDTSPQMVVMGVVHILSLAAIAWTISQKLIHAGAKTV